MPCSACDVLRAENERLERELGLVTVQMVLAQATLAESEADLAAIRGTLEGDNP